MIWEFALLYMGWLQFGTYKRLRPVVAGEPVLPQVAWAADAMNPESRP